MVIILVMADDFDNVSSAATFGEFKFLLFLGFLGCVIL